jgi:peptidoglycan/LPS O-acetylase OafA/YrhL
MAVLLYHGNVSWLPGGFLGVDVFFVISGFLITTLLWQEWQRSGRIDKPRFWGRRARRLLPALTAVIAATAIYTAIALPGELAKLRGDTIAALTYTTNWFLIFSHQSYFEAFGPPSPLRHLWSLAVEEQFYIVWPIVFGFLLRRVRGRVHRLALPLATAAAVSAVAMAVLFTPGVDPSRVYYGTDTRAAGILLGAALACVWMPWRSRRAAAAEGSGRRLEIAGAVALVVLLWCFTHAGEDDPWLYRGGFFLVSLASVVLVAAVVHPAARVLSGAFSVRPLLWVGVRSYGLYLWHWPVFVFMTPDVVHLQGTPLLLAELAVTGLLATMSYRFLELPIRTQGFGQVKRWLRVRSHERREGTSWLTAPALAVALPVGLLVVAIASATASSPFGPELAQPAAAAQVAPATTAAVGGSAIGSPAGSAGVPPRVVVVGDSVGMTMARNAPAATKQDLHLADGAISGCGILEGSVRTKARFHWSFQGCAGWPQRWAASAKQASAQVALVTIGAWDVFDLDQGGHVLTFGTPEFDAYFRSQLQLGIDALHGAGAKVALLEVPCYRPVSGGGLIALPERGDDSRTAHLNDLLRQAAAADPTDVTYVANYRAFCTDPSQGTDVRQRWDGVHYDKPGAQNVWQTITPELEAIKL